MRVALDNWLRDVGDLGDISEFEMVRRWYPDGEQPQTAAPIPIPLCGDSPGSEPHADGTAYGRPVLMQLHCATQGASIAYTFDPGVGARWLLYSEPLTLPSGTTRLRARAARIGYAESEELTTTVEIED